MSRTVPVPNLTGVILAGGQGSRCDGADKGFLQINGRPLIENMLSQLEPQVETLLISANRNHEAYARFGHPVIRDEKPEFAGPMAGVCAALNEARTDWVLCVPVDAVQLPLNFAQQMCAAAHQHGTSTVVAHDGVSIIPVACLIRRDLRGDLHAEFVAGQRSLRDWLRKHKAAELHFNDHPPPYWSINTLDELRLLNKTLPTP